MTRPTRVLFAVLIGAALPAVFWYGFFATTRNLPDSETARIPVGFIHYDIYQLYYPSLDRYFGMLRTGELPLWDPHRAVGFPAMGSYLFGIFYPLNAPFLFTSVGVGLTITSLLHFALAIFGMVRLLRGGARTDRVAAAAAGIAYAFCGFMVFSLWHPSLFNVAATAPLVAAIGDRWARKGGWQRAAAFGCAVGIQLLAGHAQGTFYLLYALAPWMIVRAWTRHGGIRGAGRLLPQAALAGALIVMTSAIAVLPARDVAERSIRPASRLSLDLVHPAGPLAPRDWAASLVDPRPAYPRADAPADAVGRYYFRGFSYVGIFVLIFALAAPFTARRRWLALAILATAGVAIALAFGAQTPLFRTFHAWMPSGDWFRFPRRFLAVAALALCVRFRPVSRRTATSLAWTAAVARRRRRCCRGDSGHVVAGRAGCARGRPPVCDRSRRTRGRASRDAASASSRRRGCAAARRRGRRVSPAHQLRPAPIGRRCTVHRA